MGVLQSVWKRIVRSLIVLAVLLTPFFSFSQDNKTEDTYTYHRMLGLAKTLLFEERYYEALQEYEKIQGRFGQTLDVIIAMAEVFFRLGDQDSAKNFFEIAEQDPNFKSNVLWSTAYYRLAILSYNRGDEKGFVNYMEKIIEEDLDKDEAIVSISLSQGLNRAISLFNLNPSFAYEAYRELGLYYITNGNETKGVFYSLTALTMLVHWGISDIILLKNPDFEFTDLYYFSETIRNIKEGGDFLSEMHVDRILYALRQYFLSDEYKNASLTDPRRRGEQQRQLEDVFALISPGNILLYSNSFEYYPIITL